tara:strand:- start:5 stop:460 length:456 start_codon:yes stop_codon:yes gene_type:complete
MPRGRTTATNNPNTRLGTTELEQSGATGEVTLDIDGATQLTIPGGSMLLTAELSRVGPDLRIEGTDGETVLVRDYFTLEESPTLLTEDGAVLRTDLIARLVGPAAPSQYAAAGDVTGAQPTGTIETLQGHVTAIRSSKVTSSRPMAMVQSA